jgi:hypothetical protein
VWQQLEKRLAAPDVIARVVYDAGYADASSPVPLAEVARKTREDVLARAHHRQIRGVQ